MNKTNLKIRTIVHNPDITIQPLSLISTCLFINGVRGTDKNAAEPDSVFISSNPIDRETCTCKGKRLYGKVRVVDISADFKVEIVDIGADLRVERVNIGAHSCGKWEFVDIGEDFTVEFVDIGGDFKVEFVDISPGIR